MHQEFNQALVGMFHIGLHIWVPSRIGVYFYVSTFIIAIYGMEALTFCLANLVAKRFPKMDGEGAVC